MESEGRTAGNGRASIRGIAFFDLDGFSRWANAQPDAAVAAFLQAFYEEAAGCLGPAGVRIVKFMGDGGLAVFAPEQIEAALSAFRALGERASGLGVAAALETNLTVKMHVGPVIEGEFGPPELARYDVLGRSVCETAMLRGRGFVLSPAARERLG